MNIEDFPVVAFFDGCCEPMNPGGNIGMGAIIFYEGKEIARYSDFEPQHERNSSNVAEYKSCIWVLEKIKSLELHKKVKVIRGDSKLVIEQMRGNWRIKHGLYVPLAHECKKLLAEIPNTKFEWIDRYQNYFADELSKSELKNRSIDFKIQPDAKG